MPLEQFAEKGDILIAHGVADLLDRAMIALQQAFGGGYAQFLEISKGAVASGLLEAAHEISGTHGDVLGRGLERERAVEIFV